MVALASSCYEPGCGKAAFFPRGTQLAKSNALATAKARVAKLQASEAKKKAVAAATSNLNKAKAQLAKAKGGASKKKAK